VVGWPPLLVAVRLLLLLSWPAAALKESRSFLTGLAAAGSPRSTSVTSRRRRSAFGLAAQPSDEKEGCLDGEVPWPKEGGGHTCEAAEAATERSLSFLLENMPPWDVFNKGALMKAQLPLTVKLALQVRSSFSWAADVPEDVWMDYVLPYANVNEARGHWRSMLLELLTGHIANATWQASTLQEVAEIVNRRVWSLLRRPGEAPIHYKENSTFLMVDDPMSIIALGYGSCTGLSILYIDALRSVGVPARLVGTPFWRGVGKNHDWVEIWLGPGQGLDGEPWIFSESLPQGQETLGDPCDRLKSRFCNAYKFNGSTEVYAVHFKRGTAEDGFTHFPMRWDLNNTHIPAENRTDFYNSICPKCASTTPPAPSMPLIHRFAESPTYSHDHDLFSKGHDP